MINQVVDDWHQTLSEWDIRAKDIRDTQSGIAEGTIMGTIRDKLPEPVTAINFAKEFGCTSILRAAFYCLSVTSLKLHDDVGDHAMTAKWTLLEKTDWMRYTRGCHLLWSSTRLTAENANMLASKKCQSDSRGPKFQTSCVRYIARLLSLVFDNDGLPMDPLDLYTTILCLDKYDKHQLRDEVPSGLRTRCECNMNRVVHARRREALWKRLGMYFGF